MGGGQRKILMFELICQRTVDQSELLIALDEPFAGVTDDFVPYMVERLNELRKRHNIILVTNDHVETLTKLADNTITVSAINRNVVKVNEMEGVDRQRAIFALSIGDEYMYKSTLEDLHFFLNVEIWNNSALMGIAMFSIICFALFVATFWDSSTDQAALVLVAGGIIAYFCVNPYLLSLVDWRNAMEEEAEALMHSSKQMNRALKTALTVTVIFLVSLAEYGVVTAVIDDLSHIKFWVAMFFDSASMTFPFICLGVYSHLSFQLVEIIGSMPFLLMIFFSTTFSPGSGVEIVKELRYLFSRFFFWCMVPGVQDDMEGCPADEGLNFLYMILSAMVGLFVFLVVQLIVSFKHKSAESEMSKLRESMQDEEFHQLQITMYGEKALKRLNHMNSSLHSIASSKATTSLQDV